MVAEINKIRSQLLTDTVVLPGEVDNRFVELTNALRHQLQPANEVEAELIDTMAMARWRQMRAASMQRKVTATVMKEQEGTAPTRYFACIQKFGEVLGELRMAEKDFNKEFVLCLRTLMHWRKGKVQVGPGLEIALTASSHTWAPEEAEEDEVVEGEVGEGEVAK